MEALIQNRIGAEPRIKAAGLRTAAGGIPYLAADALKMLTKEGIQPRGRTGSSSTSRRCSPSRRCSRCSRSSRSARRSRSAACSSGGRRALGASRSRCRSPRRRRPPLLFAIASLAVYGTSLAGWASNNKFALLGGVRASSQMISYEVALGLSLVGMMLAFSHAAARRDGHRCRATAGRSGPTSPALGASSCSRIGFLVFFAARSPRPSARRSTCPRARARSSATSSSTRA